MILNGKKASAPEFTADLILKIVVGVVILGLIIAPIIAYLLPTKATPNGGFVEELCKMNAGFRHWAPVHRAVPLMMCPEKSVTVDADDWKTCDPDGKFGFKELAKTNEYDATRECAAQQLYNLAARCWYMYGQGDWQMTAFEGLVTQEKYGCFSATAHDMPGEIGEAELTDASKRTDSCKYLPNNDGTHKCGSKDNIDFGWPGVTEIKSKNNYHICLNERSTREDAILFDDNVC